MPIDPKKILDATEKASAIQSDIVDKIAEQRNLTEEMAKLASKIGTEFEKHSKLVGLTVKDLGKEAILSREIESLSRDETDLRRGMVDLLKKRVHQEILLSELGKINNGNRAAANAEILKEQITIAKQLLRSHTLSKSEIENLNQRASILSAIHTDSAAYLSKLTLETKEIDKQLDLNRDLLHLTETVKKEKEKSSIDDKANSAMLAAQKHLSEKIADRFGAQFFKTFKLHEISAAMGYPEFLKNLSLSTELGLTFVYKVLKTGVRLFLEMDRSAFNLRKTFGLLIGNAPEFFSIIKETGLELISMGGTFEDVEKSATAIGNMFNRLVATNKTLLKDVTIMSLQFGVAQETTVEFLKTLTEISTKTIGDISEGVLGFTQQMAKASGVGLQQIMKDVAAKSEATRLYMKGSVVQFIQAATYARKVGTSLDQMASTAERLLDFESSITAEQKASVLLGYNLNFQRARQLGWTKNLIGMNEEILRITEEVGFNQLNPEQMKAYADAAGKTVAELQSMLQFKKQISELEGGSDEQRKLADEYHKMLNMKENEALETGKIAMIEVRRRLNQDRMAQIQSKFNDLMAQLAEPVMAVVGPLLDIAITILPAIISIIKGGIGTMYPFLQIIKSIGVFVVAAFDGVAGMVGTFSKFSGLISTVARISLSFMEWIPVIGWIITGLSLVYNLVTEIKNAPDGIVNGFKAVATAIYKTLVQPFIDVWDAIAHFRGNSPSELGLSIVKGLVSVGPMILDALTLPFRLFYNNTLAKLPGFSEVSAPSDYISGVKSGTSTNTSNEPSLAKIIQDSNNKIVDKLDELITMMRDGGISVNLDGRRVSYVLANTQNHYGPLGQI